MTRFDVLYIRVLCSLADLAPSISENTQLEVHFQQVFGHNAGSLKERVRDLANLHRRENRTLEDFFATVAGLVQLEGLDHIESCRRFRPRDPRKAKEINAERLWMAWIEFLHVYTPSATQPR